MLLELPASPPLDDDEPDDEDEPVPELEPAPVSVETELGGVEATVVDVVSLVVDVLVGEVAFAVVSGVALLPELLYEVDVPGALLQPARAPVASAIAAM